MSCTVMLRHSNHLDQHYSAYYPQYPTAAYNYSLDKVGENLTTTNSSSNNNTNSSNTSNNNNSRKRRAASDLAKDLEERSFKRNDFEVSRSYPHHHHLREDRHHLGDEDIKSIPKDLKMNSTESAVIRSTGLDHSQQQQHGLAGYEDHNNGGSGAGSPYMASHHHHQHHHQHHSSAHDTISSHSVAALQRLSSTLEPSGDVTGDHGSGSTSSNYHHQRTSISPPLSSEVKIRKMASLSRHHRDEDDVGSESDPGDQTVGQTSSLVDDDSHVGRAQYLTANCVVFTYFRGDTSQVVDDHFSRALSQSADKTKEFLPLSQRNLPASFWISNYQYPMSAATGSSSFSSFAHDLYHHHAAAAVAAADPYAANSLLGADVDPWQNYMAAAAGSAYSAAHHRAAHDMYHSSRLNPQYSSFLLQSSAAMRQAHGRAAAALGKSPHDSWAAVGSAAAGQALENYAGSTHSHYSTMTGLEGGMQSSSKDLYWF